MTILQRDLFDKDGLDEIKELLEEIRDLKRINKEYLEFLKDMCKLWRHSYNGHIDVDGE